MRHREDVLDLRRHPDPELAEALAHGLQSLSRWSTRGLVVLLEGQALSAEVVRLLTRAHRRLGLDGRRCAIVMPAADAIRAALTHRLTVPWVSSHEEARELLGRSRPAIRVQLFDWGRQLRVTLRGELDLVGLQIVGDELDALTSALPQCRDVVFDLSGLDFVDSHGLEAITRVAVRGLLAEAHVQLTHTPAQARALAYRLDWHHQLPGLTAGEAPRPASARKAVIATSMSGDVVHWDQGAQHLYGWAGSDVIGRPITDVTVHAADEWLAHTIMTEVRDRGAWEGDFVVQTADAPVHARVRNATLHDGLGTPVGVVGYSSRVAE